MENSRMLLSINMERLLSESGMQQKDFAEKTGISRASISKFVTNQGNPSFENIDKIADGFGVSVSELFTDHYHEDNPTSREKSLHTFLRHHPMATEIVKQLQKMDEYQLRMVHDVIKSMTSNNFGIKKKY